MSRVVNQKEEVIGERIGESEIEELVYQNEVDEEIKGVGSRDTVKHKERSDHLFLKRMMTVAKKKSTDG